jgi:hypothetical protein
MPIKIIRRPAPAVEPDPLVEDAVPAKPVDAAPTQREIEKRWKRLPGPNAKRVACAFCGRPYYQPCEGDEHEGCMNFHAAQRHQMKERTK